MSTNWKAGDKAVCIADNWNMKSHITENAPVKDSIYLVTGIRVDSKGCVGLYISGSRTFGFKKVLGLFRKKTDEAAWDQACFRKIVTLTEQAEIEAQATR